MKNVIFFYLSKNQESVTNVLEYYEYFLEILSRSLAYLLLGFDFAMASKLPTVFLSQS